MDLIDLYDRATAWAGSMIPAATRKLDVPTPCEEWTVRDLINHMLEGQELFAGAAEGKPAAPPPGRPKELMGEDPAEQYEAGRNTVLDAYRKEGALEQYGMTLGIGVVDQLVHGWDLATATGQDAAMPADIAEAALQMMDGRLPDDARGPFFKASVPVPEDAGVQEKLVAYMGRRP